MQEIIQLFNSYVKSELMVMIPVLYMINKLLLSSAIKNERIPVITSVISVALCMIYTFGTEKITDWMSVLMIIFTSITQGVIYAGASIFGDVLINPCSISEIMCPSKKRIKKGKKHKQHHKSDEKDNDNKE